VTGTCHDIFALTGDIHLEHPVTLRIMHFISDLLHVHKLILNNQSSRYQRYPGSPGMAGKPALGTPTQTDIDDLELTTRGTPELAIFLSILISHILFHFCMHLVHG